ncbi:MAG TPA: hypothetical protein ENF78_02080 [Candidatus Bathyarchaeota archaeon]|nr:hypothetical protein [Candidatus Bathyarchaeota archaeon]
MVSRLDLAVGLAVAGGFVLILSGVSGSLGLYGFLLSLLASMLPPPYDFAAYLALMALSILASLGGATVIAGGYLMYTGHLGLGRTLVSIGSGAGVIGFAALLISEALRGLGALVAFLTTMISSSGWIGILMCLVAIVLARRKPREEEEARREAEGRARVRRLVRPSSA